MLLKTIAILLTYLTITKAQNDTKIVTLSQGSVLGYKAVDSEVFQFFGIPYATAPTGSERFKPPLPPPTWTDTFEAVQNNIGCPQGFQTSQSLQVQENCLVANVIVPTTSATNLPVVFYIHGGTFFSGDGITWSPKPLVESQQLVAVTINYRLGAHGFLCLGTEDVPGNAGLRDMVAALRWVKENIANFGGNPDNVTLAGYSSGAASADLLSLSNATEGLFSKLILDSAAHVASWSIQMDPIKNAQGYAKNLGFDNIGNLDALEEFYKTASYEQLFFDTPSKPDSSITFAPCIEKDLGQEIIIDDSPINLVKSSRYRNLPVLYGFANMEGIFRLAVYDNWVPKMNEKFSDFLVVNINVEDDKKDDLAQTVKQFYFGSNNVGILTLFDYIAYFSDVMFAYPVLDSVKLQSEVGNQQIYLYEYSFYNNFIDVPGINNIMLSLPGASHCAQTEAVLENIRFSFDAFTTEAFKELKIKIRELWVNFITTGTPVPQGSSFPAWPSANASRSPYMNIGDVIELGNTINEQRTQFWDSIYEEYGYHNPIPPTFVETNAAHMVFGNIFRNLLFISLLLLISV